MRELFEVVPVGGGGLSVEQSRLRQKTAARSDGGDAGSSRGLLGQPFQKFRLLSDHCARIAPQGRKIDNVIVSVFGKGGIGGNAKAAVRQDGSLFMPMVFTFRIFSGRQSLKGDFSGLCVPAWDVVFCSAK